MARGAPFPLFYLRHFFRAGLSNVPRSLLLNCTETLATRAMADRENSVALCHGVVLKKRDRSRTERAVSLPRGDVKKDKGKKMIGCGPRERCSAIPRFGINNALQGRKERNSKGVWERAESRGLCCFN